MKTISDLMLLAKIAAQDLGHCYVGTEHVLIAYYCVYNPDLARVLINRVMTEIGAVKPTNLSSDDTTPALNRIVQKSDSILDMILYIITDRNTSGAHFLYR